MARYNMEAKAGATLQYGFALYQLEDDSKDYLLPPEIATVKWKLRSNDGTYYKEYSLLLEGNIWKLHLSPDETKALSPHKSYYYAVDAIYPSADAFRYLEGSLYIRPLGGYDNAPVGGR